MAALSPPADVDELRRAADDPDTRLELARGYGYGGWPELVAEVRRRSAFDRLDLDELRSLLGENRELAARPMRNWRDHPDEVDPLNYVAMMRYDTVNHRWHDSRPGTGALARLLIDAGAPVDGEPGTPETPLITAASYGDAEVARVLVDAGAALETLSADDSGGVPNAAALRHAAVFGNTAVLDLLLAAGARVVGLTVAAAAGDLTGWLTPDGPPEQRLLALVTAADHERLDVIDELLAAGVPIDGEDGRWGRQALRLAAVNARPRSVALLLARGADPHHRDPAEQRTALEWCRASRNLGGAGRAEVEALLARALDRT